MFGWWDDFELWLTGLPFVVQFALVMLVLLLPLCAVVASGLNRLAGLAVGWVRRRSSR